MRRRSNQLSHSSAHLVAENAESSSMQEDQPGADAHPQPGRADANPASGSGTAAAAGNAGRPPAAAAEDALAALDKAVSLATAVFSCILQRLVRCTRRVDKAVSLAKACPIGLMAACGCACFTASDPTHWL